MSEIAFVVQPIPSVAITFVSIERICRAIRQSASAIYLLVGCNEIASRVRPIGWMAAKSPAKVGLTAAAISSMAAGVQTPQPAGQPTLNPRGFGSLGSLARRVQTTKTMTTTGYLDRPSLACAARSSACVIRECAHSELSERERRPVHTLDCASWLARSARKWTCEGDRRRTRLHSCGLVEQAPATRLA